MEGALVEYRVTVTIAEHGFSDEAAESALDALLEIAEAAGPVVSQDAESGEMRLTIALDADDAWTAAEQASSVFAEALDKTGLPVTEVIGVQVTAVEREDSTENVRELVSA
jgi:hypothetical protein